MLLFRDEGHVERWCGQWRLPRGAVLTLERAWRLSRAWFGEDRGAPQWRRPPLEQVESLFTSLDLISPFWSLR